jgi:acetyl-CoA carboxylase carboxyl transferase subunit alpha
MYGNKLIDGIIKEPLGGAHANRPEIFATVKAEILRHLKDLSALDTNQRTQIRIEKFCAMGVVVE